MVSEPDGKGGLRWVEGGVITLADGSTRKFFEFDLLKPYVAAWRDIDVHPPSNPLAHPCGPSTLAASILAGSPTQLEPLTFQTSRFARNLENC